MIYSWVFHPAISHGTGIVLGFSSTTLSTIKYCSTLKMNKSKSNTIKIANIMILEFASKACVSKQNSLESCFEFSLVTLSGAVSHIWIHSLNKVEVMLPILLEV